jgi:hypothetical protein
MDCLDGLKPLIKPLIWSSNWFFGFLNLSISVIFTKEKEKKSVQF